MFDVFGPVKELLSLDPVCIDNNIFRLHYKVSSKSLTNKNAQTVLSFGLDKSSMTIHESYNVCAGQTFVTH